MGLFSNFSWFSREPGKGNILDPAGISTGEFNSSDPMGSLKNMTDPTGMNAAISPQKNSNGALESNSLGIGFYKGPNESWDSAIGNAADPGQVFGSKHNSSYLGPSQADLNQQAYMNSVPQSNYQANYAPNPNALTTQGLANGSTYASMIKGN